MTIVDHVYLAVTDLERSKAFYERALAPLGISLVLEREADAGFGREKPELFIRREEPGAVTPVHVALAASSTETVDAFHREALAAGGRDNGGPGPRPRYHSRYYGAFVLDPDGHNVEAVFHGA